MGILRSSNANAIENANEIGQMEQQFCWEVLYNLYVLHVGA